MRHFEERLAEFLQHPLQVGERRRFVDHQPLDLMEHRRVGLVGVAAIGAAGADDADRRLLRQHRAHLHRAGVGAQELAFAVGVGGEEERVVHFARRMAGREVELGEIVVVALDVRPFGDRKAHVGEDRGEFVEHLADRMDAAGVDGGAAQRQADVERFALEPRLERQRLQRNASRGERFVRFVLQRIDRRAGAAALVGRHRAQRRQQGGDRSLLAERGDARGLQRRFIVGCVDRREGLFAQGGEIGHGGPRSGTLLPLREKVSAAGRRMRDCALWRSRADPSSGARARRKTGVPTDALWRHLPSQGGKGSALTPPSAGGPWPSRRSP